MYVAAQAYPWTQMYKAAGRDLDHDTVFAICKSAGYDGWEPIVDGPEDIDRIAPLLDRHGLLIRTVYLNAELHDPASVDRQTQRVLQVARRAREAGTDYLVVNPTPIDWSRPLVKNDAQLRFQVRTMEQLGADLVGIGIGLSYHTHDSEMRAGAKELHHVLINTSAQAVGWCVDPDWIYRGTDNSSLAVEDLVSLYGERATVIHVRQSVAGVWTEGVQEGDIDYPCIARRLQAATVAPLLVMEQIPPDPAQALGRAFAEYAQSSRRIRAWFSRPI